MLVRELMSRELYRLEPHATVTEAAKMMAKEDVGSVPVCDPGVIIGMVTDRDLVVRCLARGNDPQFTEVGTIMTQKLVTVDPEADAAEAARMMAENQVRRLPVAVGRRLLGIISVGDLARADRERELVAAEEGIAHKN